MNKHSLALILGCGIALASCKKSDDQQTPTPGTGGTTTGGTVDIRGVIKSSQSWTKTKPIACAVMYM